MFNLSVFVFAFVYSVYILLFNKCIYENDEILVEHNLMDFADGSRESIIAVHELKDGKIIKTETGATLVKK